MSKNSELQSKVWLTLLREIWASHIASWLKMLIMCWQTEWLIRKFKQKYTPKRKCKHRFKYKTFFFKKERSCQTFLMFFHVTKLVLVDHSLSTIFVLLIRNGFVNQSESILITYFFFVEIMTLKCALHYLKPKWPLGYADHNWFHIRRPANFTTFGILGITLLWSISLQLIGYH